MSLSYMLIAASWNLRDSTLSLYKIFTSLYPQENDPISQRRLAVLTCQLRKAEGEKRTLKVATDKLLQFAEVGQLLI